MARRHNWNCINILFVKCKENFPYHSYLRWHWTLKNIWHVCYTWSLPFVPSANPLPLHHLSSWLLQEAALSPPQLGATFTWLPDSLLWICQLPASQTFVESVAHQIQMPSLRHLASTVSLVLTLHPLHHEPCGLVRMNLMFLRSALREEFMLYAYRQTSDILQIWFQTTSIKSKYHKKCGSHEFLVSQVHINIMFTLFCSLLNVQ